MPQNTPQTSRVLPPGHTYVKQEPLSNYSVTFHHLGYVNGVYFVDDALDVAVLQSGLGQVLIKFPYLAGRIVSKRVATNETNETETLDSNASGAYDDSSVSDGSDRKWFIRYPSDQPPLGNDEIKNEIQFNSEDYGVLFSVTSNLGVDTDCWVWSAETTLRDNVLLSNLSSDIDSSQALFLPSDSSNEEEPLLKIQCRVQYGKTVLLISLTHAIGDGHMFCTFVNEWSKCIQCILHPTNPTNATRSHSISFRTLHPSFPQFFPIETSDGFRRQPIHSNHKVLVTSRTSHTSHTPTPGAFSLQSPPFENFQASPSQLLVHFSDSHLSRMKEVVSEHAKRSGIVEHGDDGWLSTNDVLLAHVSLLYTSLCYGSKDGDAKIVRACGKNDESLVINVMTSLRGVKGVDCPLTFHGNAVLGTIFSCDKPKVNHHSSNCDFDRDYKDAVAVVANQIHHQIQSRKRDLACRQPSQNVLNELNWVEMQKDPRNIKWKTLFHEGEMLYTSWSRFDHYASFGSNTNSEAVTKNANEFGGAMPCFYLNPCGPPGVIVVQKAPSLWKDRGLVVTIFLNERGCKEFRSDSTTWKERFFQLR